MLAYASMNQAIYLWFEEKMGTGGRWKVKPDISCLNIPIVSYICYSSRKLS